MRISIFNYIEFSIRRYWNEWWKERIFRCYCL